MEFHKNWQTQILVCICQRNAWKSPFIFLYEVMTAVNISKLYHFKIEIESFDVDYVTGITPISKIELGLLRASLW